MFNFGTLFNLTWTKLCGVVAHFLEYHENTLNENEIMKINPLSLLIIYILFINVSPGVMPEDHFLTAPNNLSTFIINYPQICY